MATKNRTQSRGGSSRGTRRNNNPEGRNQYSRSPLAAAATVGGAVAAGLFLWSRRNQLSDQIAGLAEQIGEWRGGSSSNGGFAGGDLPADSGGRTQAEIAEEALTLKEIGSAS